jgi:protein-disulfide isomerase
LLRAPRRTREVPPRGARARSIEASDVVVSVEGAPFKGDEAAKVTVIEFTDYQCPCCARHFRQTWPQIERDYVKAGKAKFFLRSSTRPRAGAGRRAARAAALAFLPMSWAGLVLARGPDVVASGLDTTVVVDTNIHGPTDSSLLSWKS